MSAPTVPGAPDASTALEPPAAGQSERPGESTRPGESARPGRPERTGTIAALPLPLSATAFEVDLDRMPLPSPRHRRPFRIVLILVALLGVVAGAALRSVAAPAPAPVEAKVFATLSLRSVVLEPRPSAQLELTMDNTGDESLIADTATVAGGGLVTTAVQIGQNLAPHGKGVAAAVVVPLRCGPGERAGEPVTTRIELRVLTSGPPGPGSVVPAVPRGRLAEAGGLCAAAEAALPQGWRDPARAAAWSLTGGRLTLTVDRLPQDATALMGVQVDGVLLPLPDGPPPVQNGSVHLVLDPPQQGCRDTGGRAVVPTGLQLLFDGREGMRFSYVPVGAAVAGWLMDAYLRSCPSSPAGPSAVRTGFDV